MMIVSARVSKRKLLTALIAAVCVIFLLVSLFHKSEAPPDSGEAPTQSSEAATNEERIAFLQSFGWTVQETPVETQEVRIPEEFNDVFTRYNQLQQSQGFDLGNFAGKAVKRYVYAVTDPQVGNDGQYATLLVYKNKIIGGDVTSPGAGGKMHGFQIPAL